MGTLVEVKQQWTLDDLFDAHAVLDFREAAEARAMAMPRMGRR